MVPTMTFRILFALVFIVGIPLLNRKFQFDPDDKSGGQSPFHKAAYNKAFVHFLVAQFCHILLVMIGIHPVIVGGMLAVGIVLYEWSQKVFRIFDIAGGILGIVASYVIYIRLCIS
jgi:hypothetical protein